MSTHNPNAPMSEAALANSFTYYTGSELKLVLTGLVSQPSLDSYVTRPNIDALYMRARGEDMRDITPAMSRVLFEYVQNSFASAGLVMRHLGRLNPEYLIKRGEADDAYVFSGALLDWSNTQTDLSVQDLLSNSTGRRSITQRRYKLYGQLLAHGNVPQSGLELYEGSGERCAYSTFRSFMSMATGKGILVAVGKKALPQYKINPEYVDAVAALTCNIDLLKLEDGPQTFRKRAEQILSDSDAVRRLVAKSARTVR